MKSYRDNYFFLSNFVNKFLYLTDKSLIGIFQMKMSFSSVVLTPQHFQFLKTVGFTQISSSSTAVCLINPCYSDKHPLYFRRTQGNTIAILRVFCGFSHPRISNVVLGVWYRRVHRRVYE